ncbi:hypothetical protein GW915_13880 [bacterium]|nr:hypothetical protein [bacterium]
MRKLLFLLLAAKISTNTFASSCPALYKSYNEKLLVEYSNACKELGITIRPSATSQNIEKKLEKYLMDPSKLTKLRKSLEDHCFYGMVSGAITPYIYGLSSWTREDNPTWWSQHNSNFVLGLGVMTGLHGCISKLSPKKRMTLLKSIIGADLAANIWLEKELGINFQYDPLTGRKVRDDMEDLKSGAIAAVLYTSIGLAFEQSFRRKLRAACK